MAPKQVRRSIGARFAPAMRVAFSPHRAISRVICPAALCSPLLGKGGGVYGALAEVRCEIAESCGAKGAERSLVSWTGGVKRKEKLCSASPRGRFLRLPLHLRLEAVFS